MRQPAAAAGIEMKAFLLAIAATALALRSGLSYCDSSRAEELTERGFLLLRSEPVLQPAVPEVSDELPPSGRGPSLRLRPDASIGRAGDPAGSGSGLGIRLERVPSPFAYPLPYEPPDIALPPAGAASGNGPWGRWEERLSPPSR